MSIRLKFNKITELLRPSDRKNSWLGVAAVILFVFILNFGLYWNVSQAKQNSLLTSSLKGYGGGGDEEVVGVDSINLSLSGSGNMPDSLKCFLNPRVSFPEVFSDEDTEIQPIELGEDTFFSYFSPLTTFSSRNSRSDVITHIVSDGENPWTIAAHYGVSANTVLWANGLSASQYVKVGQELVILPVSGVRHKVVKGDTAESLAKKYNSELDKVIVFNNLPESKSLEVGGYLILPDGEMPAPPKPKYVPQNYTTLALGEAVRRAYASGHCTWYVAQKRTDIPTNWGNAKNWLGNALAAGYSVCRGANCTPTKGAIVSLKDSGWQAVLYGHVAYVESVSGNQITISEMNRLGRYKVSNRTLSIGDKKIAGYIY